MGLRGQYALEQMGVIILALVVIAALFAFSMNAASDGARTAQAKDTAERIAKAADSAYSLGPGSRSTVSINMPQGVELVNISGKRVLVRVALSTGNADAFASTRGQLVGSIPITASQQEITLTVLPSGDIAVGRTLLTCSPSSFTKTIQQGGSASDTLTLFNVWSYSISAFASSISGVSDMASNGTLPSSISSGASSTVALSFSVPGGKQVGTYTGSITVNASNASSCTSSITVFVTSSAAPDATGPAVGGLSISPASPTIATAVSVNATAIDTNNTVASCALELDNSNVWNDMSPADGSYSSASEAISYYLGTLELGSHTISAYCIDSLGNAGGVSSLNFSVAGVNGTGNATVDTQGPLVSNIVATIPGPCTSGLASINATANDSSTGGSNVGFCQLQLNGGAPSYMDKPGGAYYFAVAMGVSSQLGDLGFGNYNVSIQCTDVLGNAGPASAYYFNISVSPLCVYARIAPNGTQSAPSVSSVNGYCLAESVNSTNISYFNYTWWKNGAVNASGHYEPLTDINATVLGTAASFAYDAGFTNPTNANDGNYATFASYAAYSEKSLYWNYTNPSNSINQTVWQTKHGTAATANATLPPSCAAQATVRLKIVANNSNSTTGAGTNQLISPADDFAYTPGFSNALYANDNDYSTYAYHPLVNNTYYYLYWNYSSSLPIGLTGALWQIKHGTSAAYNNTLSAACRSQYPMQLRMSSYYLNNSYTTTTTTNATFTNTPSFVYDAGFTNPANANDANYATFAEYTAYSTATMAWAYDNPANSTNQTVWQTKHGLSAITNVTLPAACAEQALVRVRIVANNSNTTTGGNVVPSAVSANGGTFASSAGIGTIAWATPANAQTNNTVYAVATLTGTPPTISVYLNATNFGFAIPSDATITGIQALIDRKASRATYVKDHIVDLLKGGARVGSNYSSASIWTTADVPITYGGNGNLWGTTWTPAQINANNFGLVLSVNHYTGTSSITASVDYMNLTVYYNVTSPLNVTNYSQTSKVCWDGGAWVGIGTDSFATNDFSAADIYEQDLFFNTSETTSTYNLNDTYSSSAACYNGTAWASVGSASSGSAAQNGYLYEQGLFVNSSGNTTNYSLSYKQCWNGTAWAAVGANSTATNNFSASNIYEQNVYFNTTNWTATPVMNNTEYLVHSLNATFAAGQVWKFTCIGVDGANMHSANSTNLTLTG